MPRGSKDKYTNSQKKQAENIEKSYEKKGVSKERSESIAWATVNKQSGGGEKSGSGRYKSTSAKASARKNSADNAVKTKNRKVDSGAIESLTKQELLVKARDKNIQGHSKMNKAELILALRKP